MYKTAECAPLLVTLGQGVKNAVQRTRGLVLPAKDATVDAPPPALAEPKFLKGYLRKRGEKGFVRNFKLRFFEQRGDKIMYFASDKPEDMRRGIGWMDLTKLLSVERNASDPLGFNVVTVGRTYELQVVVPGTFPILSAILL